MIPIYNTQPSDWRDLQIKVAKIFADIGYETAIEANVQLARGSVNVDVLCIKQTPFLKETILIECKHWNNSIPKSIAHAFRSIIADHGANTGYIISKKGFQSGALQAIQNTNITLFSFDEFQNAFRTVWLDSVIDKIEDVGYPLRKYCNPLETFAANHYDKLSRERQEQIELLAKKYYIFSLHTIRSLYKDNMNGRLYLDYIDERITENFRDFPDIKISCLMDYFDIMYKTCRQLVSKFDNLYGQSLRKR